MFFKRNKFIILSFLIMIVIMLMSFYQFFDSHFSYAKGYYVIKENCYEEKMLIMNTVRDLLIERL